MSPRVGGSRWSIGGRGSRRGPDGLFGETQGFEMEENTKQAETVIPLYKET